MPDSSPPKPTANLVVRHLPTASINPDTSNPRAHKPPQVAAIARSIKTFGFNVPILIDGNGTVIAGHGRLAAANKLGLSVVPTIMVEHLSDTQRKAYMIADNRLTDLSRWDDQLLGEILRDLSVASLDFELDTIGSASARSTFALRRLVSSRRKILLTGPSSWR